MSRVTNLILTCGPGGEEKAIAYINAAMVDDLHQNPITDTWEAATGRKCLEAGVFITACNYLDLPEFLSAVQSAPWEDPESVQVFYQEQEDDRFTEAQLNLT